MNPGPWLTINTTSHTASPLSACLHPFFTNFPSQNRSLTDNNTVNHRELNTDSASPHFSLKKKQTQMSFTPSATIHGRSSQITLPFFILTIKPSSNQHWNGSLKPHKTALWITAEESDKPAAPAVAPSSFFSSSTIPVAVKDISVTAQTSSFWHRRLIKPWAMEAPPSKSRRDCSLSATPFLNYSRASFFFY